ncbi:MAG: hydrogenase maturation protease [Phycisphaerae bacterium]|nr:hydrogenase maturation protease [Phycisphaerae bacterium]
MSEIPKQSKILILGLGNELLMDDGIGVHVIRDLQKKSLPENVSIAEIGTAILSAQTLLEDADIAIAVDAVNIAGCPGEIFLFDGDTAMNDQYMSLHDLGIAGVMKFLPENLRPETIVVGVKPETIDYGMEMTRNLIQAVPVVTKTIELIIEEIISTNCTSEQNTYKHIASKIARKGVMS